MQPADSISVKPLPIVATCHATLFPGKKLNKEIQVKGSDTTMLNRYPVLAAKGFI